MLHNGFYLRGVLTICNNWDPRIAWGCRSVAIDPQSEAESLRKFTNISMTHDHVGYGLGHLAQSEAKQCPTEGLSAAFGPVSRDAPSRRKKSSCHLRLRSRRASEPHLANSTASRCRQEANLVLR